MFGILGQQIAIDYQRGEKLVQFEPAATAKQGCDFR